jgi:hypothetical protein
VTSCRRHKALADEASKWSAQMGRPCVPCLTKARPKMDAMLVSGTSLVDIARMFHVSTQSLRRHRDAGHIPGIQKAAPPPPVVPGLDTADVERLRADDPAVEPEPAPAPIEPVSVSLRSPSDVLGALESVVAESLALLERSKATGDLRMQNSLLNTLVATLDKLAKSVGLYSDSPTINIDASSKRLELAVAKLSDEQLLAFLSGVGELPK